MENTAILLGKKTTDNMEEKNEKKALVQRLPDGSFDMKLGQTTYKVKVYFDYEGRMSAEDRLKRVIEEEALKKSG